MNADWTALLSEEQIIKLETLSKGIIKEDSRDSGYSAIIQKTAAKRDQYHARLKEIFELANQWEKESFRYRDPKEFATELKELLAKPMPDPNGRDVEPHTLRPE